MKSVSNRLSIIEHKGKKIITVDYRGLKEKEMIELVKKHYELTLATKLSFLADFHDTFVTSAYMVHSRQFISDTKNIIDKGAFLGVDKIKSWILKGVVSMYGVRFEAFETREEALDFLTEE